MESGFGERVESINGLSQLVLTAPEMSSTEAALVLAETYETVYGIHRHTPTGDPLESILLHPLEDVSANSRLYEHVRKFFRRDVYKHSGLSLTEFFELPREICDLVYSECEVKAKEEGQISNNLAEEMKRLGRGGKV